MIPLSNNDRKKILNQNISPLDRLINENKKIIHDSYQNIKKEEQQLKKTQTSSFLGIAQSFLKF
jgi:hypothetical protein